MAEVTDPRKDAPACRHLGCGARAGDRWCYTRTGFRRHWHAVRVRAAGGQPSTEKPAGSLADRRPSERQHSIMRAALNGNGVYELSGYRFHGDAQRQAAMAAMADPVRGWFRYVRETEHGSLYELTDTGRRAHQRYEDWMNGATG